jgi:hypothetical protein
MPVGGSEQSVFCHSADLQASAQSVYVFAGNVLSWYISAAWWGLFDPAQILTFKAASDVYYGVS